MRKTFTTLQLLVQFVAALLLATTSPAAQTPLPNFSDGDDVAYLRWQVPSSVPSAGFVIRATIPVPPETYFPDDTTAPIRLVDYDNTEIAATQVNVVARYPDDADGASVIEVSGVVRKDPSWSAGTTQGFRVIKRSSTQSVPSGSPALADLLATENVGTAITKLVSGTSPYNNAYALSVHATAPDGQVYIAHLLDNPARIVRHRYGKASTTLEVFAEMMPLGTVPTGGYLHMFGVHAFLTTISGVDGLLVEIDVNNGFVNLNGSSSNDNPIGKIHFRNIRFNVLSTADLLYMEQDIPDKYSYQGYPELPSTEFYPVLSYPIVKFQGLDEESNPIVHMMPCRGHFQRRWMLAPFVSGATPTRAYLHDVGMAVCTPGSYVSNPDLLSWWNTDTPNYFPQHQVLPDLDFSNGSTYNGIDSILPWYEDLFDNLKGKLAEDPGASVSDEIAPMQLGWAYPLGSPAGTSTGSNDVFVLQGERVAGSASRSGYQYFKLRSRMFHDRQRNCLFTEDGSPARIEDLTTSCSCPPENAYITTGEFNMNFPGQHTAICPTSGFSAYTGMSLPDYDTSTVANENLNNYDPVDTQHLCRISNLSKALVWLGNDSLSRWNLQCMAELFRSHYSEFAPGSGSSYYPPLSLRFDKRFVAMHPGSAFDMDRGDGWGLDAVASYYRIASDADRVRLLPWFDQVVDVVVDGELQLIDHSYGYFGVLYATWLGQFAKIGTSCPTVPTIPPVRGRYTWQEMIVQNALRGVQRTCYVTTDSQYTDLNDVLERSYAGIVAPVSWSTSAGVPFAIVPVTEPHPNDVNHTDVPSPVSLIGYCCPSSLPSDPCVPAWDEVNAVHYFWPSAAQGWSQSSLLLYLDRALEALGAPQTLSTAQDYKDAIEAVLLTQNPLSSSASAEWVNKSVLLAEVQN